MTPDRLSRRDALRLSSVSFLGIAGCGTRTSDSEERNATSTASEPEYEHRVDSPASSKVRNSEGESAIYSLARSPEENLFESSASWDYEDWLVTAPRERDGLDFPTTTTGVEAATDFVAGTDLSEETLFVHQYNIGECETRHLTLLEWTTERKCGDVTCVGIRLGYERAEDSACQDDDTDGSDGPPYAEGSYDSEAVLVRIPGEIQSYGAFSFGG